MRRLFASEAANRFFDCALDFLYPNKCGFCGKAVPYGSFACSACKSGVKVMTDKWSNLNMDAVMSRRYALVGLTSCFSAARYSGIVKNGMIRLKRKSVNTAAQLCPVLANKLYGLHADYITFVPISKRRKYIYGYNHSEVIARYLSEMTDVPVLNGVITKVSNHYQHSQSDIAKRMKLSQSSYRVSNKCPNLNGKTVILCDDIITTGSTLSTCCSILQSAGAKNVVCASLAVTVNKKSIRQKSR